MPSKAPNLFRQRQAAPRSPGVAPLADRMRPRTLDEFVGQEHIVGPGRLLRRAIEADRLSSVIFYGPPGTGKTTLARVIANTTRAQFTTLNAVLSGVKDIREAIADAKARLDLDDGRTILFVDEVHRFNKAQQDALLPWVENGTVILIGATTENPYFEVNNALVSRSRVFQLRVLDESHLREIARSAIADPERGYGALRVDLADDALDHLVNVADGDARALLNALELAVETSPPDADGRIRIDLSVAEESIQQRAVLYDREGDVHYDTTSAFIKSLRGSDPDAALYWLARMVYAGEDPRFIFRRMLILAAEDVGLADPQAVVVVRACASAFDYVGLPEGQFHLAEAALYLALAPKSNSILAYFDALGAVEKEPGEVPSHLKDANRDKDGFGHGEGYKYPHAYRDHWIAQQYLPASLSGRTFYVPSQEGAEASIAQRTAHRREAQLAAMLEDDTPGERLSSAGKRAGATRERWLARLGSRAAHLGEIRDRVFAAAGVQRHSAVLDLRLGAGLLTFEALRQAPEGGVWAVAGEPEAAQALLAQLERLDAVERPTLLIGPGEELAALLDEASAGDVRFDAVVGWKALETAASAGQVLAAAGGRMAPGARLSLAEPAGAPRGPLSLLEEGALEPALAARIALVEAAALDRDNPRMTAPALAGLLQSAGLQRIEVQAADLHGELRVTPGLLARWFREGAPYRVALEAELTPDELDAVRSAVSALLRAPPRPWPATVLLATATAP